MNKRTNPTGTKAATRLMPVRLLKGYAPASGGPMIPKGETVKLPLKEAKAILDAGLAERADPLPS